MTGQKWKWVERRPEGYSHTRNAASNERTATAEVGSPQMWNIQPSGSGASITSVQTGLALDGGANQSGTNPQLWSANGTVDQQWKFQ